VHTQTAKPATVLLQGGICREIAMEQPVTAEDMAQHEPTGEAVAADGGSWVAKAALGGVGASSCAQPSIVLLLGYT
jgi:hypothetical protein